MTKINLEKSSFDIKKTLNNYFHMFKNLDVAVHC